MARAEFKSHELNEVGKNRAAELGTLFSDLLTKLEELGVEDSREASITLTHLQTAKFWATRAIAVAEENQVS